MRTIIATPDNYKNASVQSVSALVRLEDTVIETLDFGVGLTADLGALVVQANLSIYYIHPLYVAEAALLRGSDVQQVQTMMRLVMTELTDFYKSNRSSIELKALDLEQVEPAATNSDLRSAAIRLVASQLLYNDTHIAKKLIELEACSVSTFERAPWVPAAELLSAISASEEKALDTSGKLDTLMAQNETMQSEINHLKTEEAEAKAGLERENQEILEQLSKAQEAYKTLSAEKQDIELKRQRAEADLGEANERVTTLNAELGVVISSHEAAKQDIELKRQRAEADLGEANERVTTLNAELGVVISSHEAALSNIGRLKTDLEAALAELEGESKKLAAEAEAKAGLERENQEILEQLFKVQQSYEQLLEQNNLKQNELARAYLNVSELRSQKAKDDSYILWLTSSIEQANKQSLAQNWRFKRALASNRKLVERFSSIFDVTYYVKNHPEVSGSELPPLDHYLLVGCYEGKNPSSGFDTYAYLIEYPDVAKSGFNPLIHYIKYGQFEGRNPSPEIKRLPILPEEGRQ